MKKWVSRLMTITMAMAGACCAAEAQNCEPSGGISFLCGPAAVEDLVRIPGTKWIIGSGMGEKGGSGKLHIIDAGKKTWEVLYPGPQAGIEQDSSSYPACSGAPDPKTSGRTGSRSEWTGPKQRFSRSTMGVKP